MTPEGRFTHDCESCVYLGTGRVEGRQVDWYVCKDKGSLGGSIIGRYGSEGSHYWSTPICMVTVHSPSPFERAASKLLPRTYWAAVSK